jgi:hypothetical protein
MIRPRKRRDGWRAGERAIVVDDESAVDAKGLGQLLHRRVDTPSRYDVATIEIRACPLRRRRSSSHSGK